LFDAERALSMGSEIRLESPRIEAEVVTDKGSDMPLHESGTMLTQPTKYVRIENNVIVETEEDDPSQASKGRTYMGWQESQNESANFFSANQSDILSLNKSKSTKSPLN
jgi:hypothetical protein